MIRITIMLSLAGVVLSSATIGAQALPRELDGWPVVKLAQATAPDSRLWVGTYGHGVLVRGSSDPEWRRIQSDTSATSLSWDFVQAIAFGPKGEVWVGTVGNGWGLSRDNGKTWRNWTYNELGPEWQYVIPNGIVTEGDTTVIATADGLQMTTDDGEHWLAVIDGQGPPSKGPADTAIVALSNEYLLGINKGDPGWIFVRSLPRSGDFGFLRLKLSELLAGRVPENSSYRVTTGFTPRGNTEQQFRRVIDSLEPLMPEWDPPFVRPIGMEDNYYIDQTYRWGSTMGGNFQPHQGIEFNNSDGTPVHAIGSGLVVWSGPAEAGALTVAIRHEPITIYDGTIRYIYSVYYHNSKLDVAVGDTVATGQLISEVGNTGRATNDHLHLEVHASPVDDVKLIVDPEVRYPPYTTNPELWLKPLPGTGMIAGRIFDSDGNPVPQARIYGIHKLDPKETPFAFAETYGERNSPSPMYQEHFAVGDVPAGRHRLKVKIGDEWVEEEVMVAPGVMTWVELRAPN